VDLGEGLSAAGNQALLQMGVREAFLDGPHLPSGPSRSSWGQPDTSYNRTSPDLPGYGWQLDRSAFDAMLAAGVLEAGGSVAPGTRVLAWRREPGGWALSTSGESGGEIHARYLVDASGRAGRVVRAQGVRRRVFDRLVATVGVIATEYLPDAAEPYTLVEATEEGWWYSCPLPDGRLVAGYLTDGDLASRQIARSRRGWGTLLQRSEHTRSRINVSLPELDGPLIHASARSSCQETVIGEGWLAVGDAAATYDPLSGYGITAALTSGVAAARAIAAGSEEALRDYDAWMTDSYARYLSSWLAYYSLEQRWPNSAFWSRRHETLSRLLAS
jgi:flavin-dependent dehydrogenase